MIKSISLYGILCCTSAHLRLNVAVLRGSASCVVTESDAELRCSREAETRQRKTEKHAKLIFWDNIFKPFTPAGLIGLGHQMNTHSMMSLFPQLEALSRSLFKHEIRLDEICIHQFSPMTAPSVNVIGKLLAKLVFSHLLCRFVLTTSTWIFHRPYVPVHRGHGDEILKGEKCRCCSCTVRFHYQDTLCTSGKHLIIGPSIVMTLL